MVIIKKSDVITLSNPGDFRIEVETAISGGVSDPRNSALIKMFNLIEVGERAGSGIPNIFNVWNKQGWSVPVITEGFDPERITLSLNLGKTSDKKQSTKTSAHKEAIVVYLTNNASAKCAEISALIGVSIPRTRAILSEMVEDDIIKAEGENKNRI